MPRTWTELVNLNGWRRRGRSSRHIARRCASPADLSPRRPVAGRRATRAGLPTGRLPDRPLRAGFAPYMRAPIFLTSRDDRGS